MSRPIITDVLEGLQSLVRCSPAEWEKECLRFNAFVIIENENDLNELFTGVTQDTTKKFDYVRNPNILNVPLLAARVNLTSKDTYTINLYGLAVYDKFIELNRNTNQVCKDLNEIEVIEKMRKATQTIIDTLPTISKLQDCEPKFGFGGDCELMDKIIIDSFVDISVSTNCFAGVKVTFDIKVENECLDYVFECK